MQPKQSKAHQIRVERELNELFKLPGNDRCADCQSKNPRWASYSLGVFLCIRCASLHRKMGTHISKVKSVSMDCWTLQDIQNIRALGGNQAVNKEINTIGRLPVAADDDLLLEKYIRDKWERKLFQEEIVPTPSLSSTESSIISSPTSEIHPPLPQFNNQLPSSTSSSSFSSSHLPATSPPSTFTDRQPPTKHFSVSSTPTTAWNPANPFNILVDNNISSNVSSNASSNNIFSVSNNSNHTNSSNINHNNPFKSFSSSPQPDFSSNYNVLTPIDGNSSGHTQQQPFNTFHYTMPLKANTLPAMSTTSSNPFLQQAQQQQQQQQYHMSPFWPTGHQ